MLDHDAPEAAEEPAGGCAQSVALGKAKYPHVFSKSGSPYRGRTGTPFRAEDFKSSAYAIPPRGRASVAHLEPYSTLGPLVHGCFTRVGRPRGLLLLEERFAEATW